jgi:hypothetical protein
LFINNLSSMKKYMVFLAIVTFTQNVFSQKKFFQCVKYDGKSSGVEKVSQFGKNYMGLLIFNTGSTWGRFDSLGRLSSYSYLDSFDNKGYRIDYSHNNHSSYIAHSNMFVPGLKFFSPAQHLLTACMSKLDSVGNLIKTYDYNYNNPAEFSSVALSTDNKILASGRVYTDTLTGPLICDALVAKLDTDGTELWHYRYVGAFAQDPGGIMATPDSGAVVVLTSGGYPGVNEVRIIKLNKMGQLQWMKKPPLPIGIYNVYLIDHDPIKNNFVLLTNTYPDTMIIAKYDSSMKAIWEIKYKATDINGSRNLGIVQMIKDRNGYIACGVDQRSNADDHIGWVLKIDENGKQLWEADYHEKYRNILNNYYDTYFFGIDTTSDSGYIIGGTTRDSLGNQVGVLVKLDSTGCLTDTACETRYFTGISTINEELEGVRLYPNPASSSITIALSQATNESKTLQLEIYDLLGRAVANYEMQGTEKTIPISSWESGSYFCILKSNHQTQWRGKFIKE